MSYDILQHFLNTFFISMHSSNKTQKNQNKNYGIHKDLDCLFCKQLHVKKETFLMFFFMSLSCGPDERASD